MSCNVQRSHRGGCDEKGPDMQDPGLVWGGLLGDGYSLSSLKNPFISAERHLTRTHLSIGKQLPHVCSVSDIWLGSWWLIQKTSSQINMKMPGHERIFFTIWCDGNWQCRSAGSHLYSSLKYFYNYWVNCYIHGAQWMKLNDLLSFSLRSDCENEVCC